MSDDARTRRSFLRSTGCAIAALTAGTLVPVDLRALPTHVVTGERTGTERRYPIPAADSVNVDHGESAILVRYQGKVFGMSLGCPHEHAAVRWVEKERRFQCTKHDSRYQEDGVHTSGRATRNLDRFAIRRDGDAVVLDFDHVFQSDADPAGWAAAVISL